MAQPTITQIEIVQLEHQIQGMGTDYNGFNTVYEKGGTLPQRPGIFRVHTSEGIVGEYLGGRVAQLDSVAGYLIGKNPFEREKIYNDLKRGLRHTDRTAICMVDVALWDFAGKAYSVPIYQMLGAIKRKSLLTRARTTGTKMVGWIQRRPSQISPCSVGIWDTRRSRFTAGGTGRSRGKCRPCSRHASAWETTRI